MTLRVVLLLVVLLAVASPATARPLTVDRAERAITRAWRREAFEAYAFRCHRTGRRRVVCRDAVYFAGVLPGAGIDVVMLRRQRIRVRLGAHDRRARLPPRLIGPP